MERPDWKHIYNHSHQRILSRLIRCGYLRARGIDANKAFGLYYLILVSKKTKTKDCTS